MKICNCHWTNWGKQYAPDGRTLQYRFCIACGATTNMKGKTGMNKKIIDFDWTRFGCYTEAVKDVFLAAGFEVNSEPELKVGMRVRIKSEGPYDNKAAIINKITGFRYHVWIDYYTSRPKSLSFRKENLKPSINT